MTLPNDNVAWPPPSFKSAELKLHKALYSGRTPGKDTWEYEPAPDLASEGSERTAERRRVRGGLAATIAAKSANMMYGKGIGIVVPVQSKEEAEIAKAESEEAFLAGWQKRIGLNNTLREGGEFQSALGDAFWIMTADPTISDDPFYIAVDPSRVDPIFAGPYLVSATVWTDVAIAGDTIYRWIQNIDNRRRTHHFALYKGTRNALGVRQTIASLDQTRWLVTTIEADGSETVDTSATEILESFPGETKRMIFTAANVKPDRCNTSSPQGRADTQGIESICVAVDVVLTSLLQDVRLGRTKIIVPLTMLDPAAVQANGAKWDAEKEIFTFMEMDPDNPGSGPRLIQGLIRATDHHSVLQELVQFAARHAGYATQSWGMDISSTAEQSGAAKRMELESSISTTLTKRPYTEPVLIDMVQQAIHAGRAVFGWTIDPAEVLITWPEIVDDNPQERAEVISTLMEGKAISVSTAVAMQNPHLGVVDVELEVEKILREHGISEDAIAETKVVAPTDPAGR